MKLSSCRHNFVWQRSSPWPPKALPLARLCPEGVKLFCVFKYSKLISTRRSLQHQWTCQQSVRLQPCYSLEVAYFANVQSRLLLRMLHDTMTISTTTLLMIIESWEGQYRYSGIRHRRHSLECYLVSRLFHYCYGWRQRSRRGDVL